VGRTERSNWQRMAIAAAFSGAMAWQHGDPRCFGWLFYRGFLMNAEEGVGLGVYSSQTDVVAIRF